MPIGTPVTLGTTSSATSSSSYTHTTVTNNGASGDKAIILCSGIAASGAAPAMTLTGGPGGWTKRKEVSSASLSGGFGGVATIWDVDLASTLSTGTVLTFASSVGLFGLGMMAITVSGLGTADSGVVDGRAKTTGSTTFDTQATTAPNTTTASAFTIAVSVIDASTSITITAPPVELFDFTNPNAWAHIVAYEIKSATGAARIQGTWGASAPDISALAAYQGAGGATSTGGGGGPARPGRHRGRFPGREQVWF